MDTSVDADLRIGADPDQDDPEGLAITARANVAERLPQGGQGEDHAAARGVQG